MSHLRLCACVALIVLTSICLAATRPQAAKPTAPQAVPKVVRAQTFELTDASEKPRAWLGTLDDGTTLLRLYDKDGKQKVIVDSNGGIMVVDAAGKARVTAGTMDDDYGIGVFDANGKIRADVRVNQDGEPAVTVRGSAGDPRGTLTVSNDEPTLLLKDAQELGAHMMLHINGSLPIFSLWDASAKPRASFSLMEEGLPLLQMTDADGKALAELSTGGGSPSLMLECRKSKMTAFLGFTESNALSLMFLNDQDEAQVGLTLTDHRPTMAVCHDNGTPGAGMRIEDDGVPFFYTSDKDNNKLWNLLDDLTPP